MNTPMPAIRKASEISPLELLLPDGQKFGNHPAIRYFSQNQWRNISFDELRLTVEQVSARLLEAGVKPQDRVALLSEPRPEWIAGLYGILRAGAIAVPLDIKATVQELSSNLLDCTPKVLLTTHYYRGLAEQLKNRVGSIRECIVLDEIIFEGLSLDPELPEVSLEDTALLIYTSGTTGRPKGVMIPYRSLVSQTHELCRTMALSAGETFLSIIPMNHLFELTGALLSPIRYGSTVALGTSLYPEDVLRALKDNAVTRMTVVPLFLKMLKSGFERKIASSNFIMRFLFKIFPRLLRSPLGISFREFISGGAALDIEVLQFFEKMGVRICQGYGMTEAGPVISTNNYHHNRLGSVGRPLSTTEVKIVKDDPAAKDGEICIRGPQVMTGYWLQPDLTREVLSEDGWLQTGDLGYTDDDGYLYVTGRLKSMIVLDGGKKILPEEVEAALMKCPRIKEVCVTYSKDMGATVAGARSQTSALRLYAVIVPHENFATSRSHDELLQSFERDIAKFCLELAPFKRPERVVVRYEELPKSTARKIKRMEVLKWLTTQMENESSSSSNLGG